MTFQSQVRRFSKSQQYNSRHERQPIPRGGTRCNRREYARPMSVKSYLTSLTTVASKLYPTMPHFQTSPSSPPFSLGTSPPCFPLPLPPTPSHGPPSNPTSHLRSFLASRTGSRPTSWPSSQLASPTPRSSARCT